MLVKARTALWPTWVPGLRSGAMPSTSVGMAAGLERSSLPLTTVHASIAHTVTFGSVPLSLASRLSREYQPASGSLDERIKAGA
jgi:hypothetical protein